MEIYIKILNILIILIAIILTIKNNKMIDDIIKRYQTIFKEHRKMTLKLMMKISKINLIIYDDISDEEKIKKIEKVIHSNDNADNLKINI